LEYRDQPTSDDAQRIGNDSKDWSHEEGSENARDDQLAHGVGAEGAERVNLIGDHHRAELGGDPRPDAPGEHQTREHRPELLHHRRTDDLPYERPRTELVERDAGLQDENGAGEEAREEDHGEGADAYLLELLDDVTEIERPRHHAAQRRALQTDVLLNLENRRFRPFYEELEH
jgi:hypothetical protein